MRPRLTPRDMAASVEARRRARTLLVSVMATAALAASAVEGSWIRFMIPVGHGPEDSPGVPLVIADYNGDVGMTFSATGWYRYIQGRDPVVFHGKKEGGGTFAPVATYEVATEDKRKWKKIPKLVEQPRSETVTVSPENPLIPVSLDMEPFRRWIGTYRYGKVILENGDSAIIDLEDLLPTPDARDAIGNFKEDLFGGHFISKEYLFSKAAREAAADLSVVTCLGDRLMGDFTFYVPQSGKSVTLDGSRTLDGDFWPKVTLQVGNSQQDWKTIGKSQNAGTPAILQIPPDKAERVRILLNDYKPLVGKYKYGKVIFSNGDYAVFYLERLNPQS
jgi:hypothetical protein